MKSKTNGRLTNGYKSLGLKGTNMKEFHVLFSKVSTDF